ncbi:Superkiller protein 3 [Arachnomyces sp. PD_36]|nr:Superkiller protein 3 [Arachnomyces sp. PD_36]
MSGKAALKAVRAALDTEDFQSAVSKAQALVEQDPSNYHGYVFLGLAQDKLNNNDEAERAYTAAADIKPDDRTAWQGLIRLYEKQSDRKLDRYGDAVVKLGHIFATAEDRTRCQDVLDKYTLFVKKHGSRSQYKQALKLQLPSCSLYDFLEGRIPHPSHTYLRIIEISESEEKEFINREIGERRTRLGAKIDQVTKEVKREAFDRIGLDKLYREIIDWSNDDSIRRTYEEKLLTRAHDLLQVLPASKKQEKRKEVIRLAQEMVIIKHPFELAWKITLEWKDAEDLSDWDVGTLQQFIELFPDDGLSKVLKGFFGCDICPFPKEQISVDSDDEDSDGSITSEDRLLLMTEGLAQSTDSILSHRIMGMLFLSLEEFRTAVEVCRKADKLIQQLISDTGLKLQNTSDAINISLANALISYQSPRYHPEAKTLFEAILQRKPSSTASLLGVGIILEEDENYADAVDFLDRAIQRDPENVKIREELSWCQALNGNLEQGLHGLEETLTQIRSAEKRNRELEAETLYRIGYCQWELEPSPTSRRDRSGAYASFLSSIQSNINFAPPYTSLGIFYADYKQDKKRARRCFHKAFELSPSEIEAGERLARAFADQGEWDLVEAIAQRVVDSGKAKPATGSKRKGHSWPYAALGVVQINKQQYSKSIVSFQAALRISPQDYQSWIGLGESYHNSGRYVAATKAFQHAMTLESNLTKSEQGQIWFTRYMLANVNRELGEFEESINGFEEVLVMKPDEFGVSIALLQTLTESAWKSVESGVFNDAAESARKAIDTATIVAKSWVNVFNLWKAVGDACSVFSWIKNKAPLMSFTDVQSLFGSHVDETAFEAVADVDGLGTDPLALLRAEDDNPSACSNACLYAAILAYKRAVSVSSHEVHAQAVAWYNLGWSEYRAYKCLDLESTGKSKKALKRFLKAAMRCFKRAIELEAGNSEFWNALGVVTTSLSPKVAQHSFVRSLHLNDKSAQVWTNLGTLYLLQNDIQLANEAFTRAQSADPDFSHAWLGQGVLALLLGNSNEARELVTHAFEIANSASPVPKRRYAMSVFDHLLSDPTSSNDITQLIQPLFALHQLHCQEPSDLVYERLSALFAERVGELSEADETMKRVCDGVEAEYEVSESVSSLSRYAQAKADLARTQLALDNYEEAVESAETALSLSSEDEAGFDPEVRRVLRLSAHLVGGLAYYYLNSMDQSIDMFRDALRESDSAPEVVCLLAQVLWAKGETEERGVACEQLLDCVTRNPDNVGAATALGVISILDSDQDAIEAAEADLQAMRTRDDLDIYDRAKVAKLLAGFSALGFTDSDVPGETRRIGEATRSVMLAPSQPQGWLELSTASSELYPAEMALQTALRNAPPRGKLEAADLCKSYAQTGRRSDAVQATMMAPWKADGWDELNSSLTPSGE